MTATARPFPIQRSSEFIEDAISEPMRAVIGYPTIIFRGDVVWPKPVEGITVWSLDGDWFWTHDQ